MGVSRRTFTREFKLAAVRRLEAGVSIAEVARGLEVNPNILHRWRREFRQGPGNAFPGQGQRRWSEGKIAELEPKVGQQAMEILNRFDLFATFTGELEKLVDWLQRCTIRTVAMESTGVYWIPLFQILEKRGIEVCLVNAQHLRNVPGGRQMSKIVSGFNTSTP